MDGFLDAISWQMNIIQPYGAVHLAVVIAALVCDLALVFSLRKVRSRILYPCIGVFLAAAEVIKQLLLTRICGGYSWTDFPFQLCSVPMYLCLLYPFIKKQWVDDFLMIFSVIGGTAAFLEPTSSFTGYVFLTVHSILWHTVLLFLGFRQMYFFMQKKEVSVRDYYKAGAVYLVCAAVAVIINSCAYKVSSGTCNMFFLGPGYPYAVILDSIYKKCGWITETVTMVTVSFTAGLILYYALVLMHKIKSNKTV